MTEEGVPSAESSVVGFMQPATGCPSSGMVPLSLGQINRMEGSIFKSTPLHYVTSSRPGCISGPASSAHQHPQRSCCVT
ncbi:unnamed protein product [Protopolystoma xenopodis]|uniref:Uncharacterized protein n=1 Tax=Protopolystoma xenopodis TaxID=117903 RepID=A0A3S5ALE0_9PLAT|nr:unnamed protein product [Protopolystoma xenopodis]